ncbi:Ig-like domain-containing protein [Demequina sp. SO4-13]|uniref:Ig-like domain-containing protein n=1 Tax=Demequina sp. SO4-13 TaxID=3401027 RepID=UPI003AF7B32B
MRLTRAFFPAVLTAALAATVLVPAAQAAEAPQPVAHYPLTEDVADVVGSYDGTVNGTVTYPDGLRLTGGSNTGPFVDLPPGLITDRGEDLTVSVWVKREVANGNYAAMFFGTAPVSNVPQNYWILNPASPAGYFKSVFTNSTGTSPWSTEVGPSGSANSVSTTSLRSKWALYTTVFTETSIQGYLNGVPVGPAQTKALAIGDFSGPIDVMIGKSNYTADQTYNGSYRDLMVFEDALDASAIEQIYLDAIDVPQAGPASASSSTTADTVMATWSAVEAGGDWEPVSGYRVTLTDTTTSAVTTEEVGASATSATLSGVADGTYDVSVAAFNAAGSSPATSAGTVTVIANPTDEQLVQRAADGLAEIAALTAPQADAVRGSLTLPETLAALQGEVTDAGAADVTIDWVSSDPAVISDADVAPGSTTDGVADVIEQGFVTRPDVDTDVTLTATITSGAESDAVAFDLTVLADPGLTDESYESYLFSYFTGNTTAGQQIYMATARGNDALEWDEVNDGEAVLTSSEGTGGLRDPSIVRSVDGDSFYMLATDLDITQTTWPEAYTNGSRYLEIWESTDLVNWTEQRHTLIAPEWVGMTWAPEATWDPSIGAYLVYWSSRVYPEGEPHVTGAPGTTTARTVAVTTRDFVNFSDPFIWVDEGDQIDADVFTDDGTFYRFIKEVAGPAGCQGIITDYSTELRSVLTAEDTGAWTPIEDCVTQNADYTPIVEGSTTFKANPGDVNGPGYYMFADYFNGDGYQAFFTEDISQPGWDYLNPATDDRVDLPGAPRHGSVIPITRAERDGVLAAYQPEMLVTSVVPETLEVAVGTDSGITPPATVTAVYGNDGDRTEEVEVEWETIDYGPLATVGGTTTVTGSLLNGAATPATFEITAVAAAPTSVSVTPTTLDLELGDTGSLAATVAPAEASQTVTWSSDDESVATVSASGVVTAVAAGTATVTATSTANSSLSGSADVTVAAPAPELESIAVTQLPSKSEYVVGDDLDLDGLEVTATWTGQSTTVLDAAEYTVSGFDSSVAATVMVSVTSTDDASITTSFTVTVSEPAPVEFANMDESLEHYDSIMWLADRGITQGGVVDGETQFRPFNKITRDAMATFLYRYAGSPDVTLPAQSPFADVDVSSEHYEAIVWLAQEGISEGWDTNAGQEFRPFEPITRDAMAAFLYRLADEPTWVEPVNSPFVDITSTNTEFYTEITWLEDTGITTGWQTDEGTKFLPYRSTTRDAMAAFLNRYDNLPK